MLNYIIRRLAIGVVTLLLITFIVFGLVWNMPGDMVTVNLSESDPSKQISKEEKEAMKKLYGLDKPFPVAYAIWVGNILQGDLGVSFPNNQRPVSLLIRERMGATLLLSGASLALTYMLAVPMGLYATARAGSVDERAMSTVLYMLYSIPSFVAGLILLIVFWVHLADTPFHLPPGMSSDDYATLSLPEKVWDTLKHMILPVACTTYVSLAYYSRFVKANMEEVIRQDYIRTARAKGVSWYTILISHAFRNTLIPFVTSVGLSLPALMSGSVIVETIFQWRGMGLLLFEALANRDYQTIMALELIFAVLTLVGTLVADLLYAVVDPRIVYS